MEGLAASLGRFVQDQPREGIPEAARDRIRISLAHNLCVALAGRALNGVADRYAAQAGAGLPEATALATGQRISVPMAALANGSLIHIRSQDDTHAGSTSHPGAPVMAAALAEGEARRAGGAEVLEAMVIGYEVLFRIGALCHDALTARGFRSAAVLGSFGAAAASCRIAGLHADRVAQALAFCAHGAGGLSQVWVEGAGEHGLQLGMAARNGVEAAHLSACGLQAASRAFEGPRGFLAAYAGLRPEDLPTDWPRWQEGQGWLSREVTVKRFPCCAILQGPLQLLENQLQRTGPDPVDRLVLTLNPYEADYPGIDNPGPGFASPMVAKMSAQFCLGTMLARRRLLFDDLLCLDDATVLDAARAVTVARDPALSLRQCRVDLHLRSGRHVSARLTEPAGQPDAKGIEDFARRIAAEAGLSEPALLAVVSEALALDRAPDLHPLVQAIRALPPAESAANTAPQDQKSSSAWGSGGQTT